MLANETRDILIRTRFLAVCCGILWAFWGMARFAEIGGERYSLVWTNPDPDVVAILMNLSCDDDAGERPGGSE